MGSRSGKGAATGAVFITLTLLAWSSVPLFLKYFTSYIDAWTANGWRYGVSALLWAPVLIWHAHRHTLPGRLWRAALVPSIINCTGQCCFAWTPYLIDPALLTFMLRFQIIFVAFGAYLLFTDERHVLRSPRYWIGIVIVLGGSIGTCLLGAELPRGATALGVALAIAAGVLFGGYSLSVRYYMQNIHPVTAFAAISQYTAAGVITIMLLIGNEHGLGAWSLSTGKFGILLASGLVGIAVAHVFYYSSIARLGVAVSAGVILLQPFCTGAASYFIFGERLTALQWISGSAAMVGAVVMLSMPRRRKRPTGLRPVEPLSPGALVQTQHH